MPQPIAFPSQNPSPSPTPEAVVAKAVVRAADNLGLKGGELAEIIGLSAASVSRLKKGDFPLSGKSYELALHVIRLYRSLSALTAGDDKVAQAWVRNPNAALSKTPLEAMRSIEGLLASVAYVDAHRAPL